MIHTPKISTHLHSVIAALCPSISWTDGSYHNDECDSVLGRKKTWGDNTHIQIHFPNWEEYTGFQLSGMTGAQSQCEIDGEFLHTESPSELREMIKRWEALLDAQTIPTLTSNSTLADVAAYLRWLKGSEYAYHIDDDPREIHEGNVGIKLRANMEVCEARCAEFQSDGKAVIIWELYAPKIHAIRNKH